MAPTSTIRPHGTRGANRAPTNRITSETMPTSAVVPLSCGNEVRIDHARSWTAPAVIGIPSRLGISPITMRMTRPKTKPVTMGRDMNSAAQPSRAMPPMSRPIPAPMARAEVRATARTTLPCAMSATSEPESTDTVETGPTIRWGDEPRIAYAMSASGIAYRPTMMGTPAMPA